MSTTTAKRMPRFIAGETGVPAYLFRTPGDGTVWRRYSPHLPPMSGWQWATAEDITTPAVELTVGVLAELLLIAGIEPESDITELIDAAARVLDWCCCDLRKVAGIAEAYLDAHWECAQRQLDRYTLAAGRMYGIEV